MSFTLSLSGFQRWKRPAVLTEDDRAYLAALRASGSRSLAEARRVRALGYVYLAADHRAAARHYYAAAARVLIDARGLEQRRTAP